MIELNEHQAKVLTTAADSGSYTFVVMYSNASDVPNTKESLDKISKGCEDMLAAGLLQDVSDKFEDTIKLALINHKRVIRMMQLTDHAVKLFENHSERTIN